MIARSESHGILAVETSAPGRGPDDYLLGVENVKDRLLRLSAGKLASHVISALTPEIFQRRRTGAAHRALRPTTAWLDGLRGWAAFIVCFVHLTVYTHPTVELCYGHEISPGTFNTSPAAWPFIRLLWSGGHFAVLLFFTISGYVLTQKLFSLLHEGRRDDFVEAINSAMFRRTLRLFLPVVFSTLTFLSVWHIFGIATPWPPRQPTLFSELVAWCDETLRFFNLYRGGFLFTYYNIHTWTIPVELRGSMLIFVWLFSMHQVAGRPRILMTLVMALYFALGCPGAWYACFFAGALTAELHLLDAKGSTPPIKLPWDGFLRAMRARPRLCTLVVHLMLLAGLYLGSEPSADNMRAEEVLGTCPGWKTLSKLIPASYADENNKAQHRWFWLFWASWLVLASGREIGWFRRFLETDFSQYLGRISFALYLIHGPMIGILSERLFYLTGIKTATDLDQAARFGHLQNKWRDAEWWPFADSGPPGLEPNFLVCAVISIIAFLYVAELGTRMFDTPSVRISSWAWKKVRSIR